MCTPTGAIDLLILYFKESHVGLVRTNIELDPLQVARAKQITGLKTTKEVVHFALQRLASSAKGLSALIQLSGKVRFKKGYSYKRAR